ncbi:MAG: hypothetical protein ACOX1T_03355 [Saccharofermentanales bacterium]
MDKSNENISEVFDSGNIHGKQSLINNLRPTVLSPVEAMSKLIELTKVPLNKRDVFFYIIEFMLKVNQFTNGYNLEVALLAAKIETVRRVTNYMLNHSNNHYLLYGFDFLIGLEMITHHDISENGSVLDDKIDDNVTELQELKRILLNMDKSNNNDQLDLHVPAFIDHAVRSVNVECDELISEIMNKSLTFAVCEWLDVGKNISFPTDGIYSFNCLVEDVSYKEHEILILCNISTGNNRCRIIGYDYNMQRFVRLTHVKFDESVNMHCPHDTTSMTRLCSVRERSRIKVFVRKLMHNMYCDLLMVEDDSVIVLDRLSSTKYLEFLKERAGKSNPNKLWQSMKKNFENSASDYQIFRMVNVCVKTLRNESISESELLNLVRIKNSRIEFKKGHWFCSLYRKEVSWYKLRIFDKKATSMLDKNKIYRFEGIALIEFIAPTSIGRDPIVNVLKLIIEKESERPMQMPVKIGNNNYLLDQNDESMQDESTDSDEFENDIFSNIDDDFYVNDLAYELHDAQEFINDDYDDESFSDDSGNTEDQFDYLEDDSYYHQLAYDQFEEDRQIYADILIEDYFENNSPETTIPKAYETANDVCKILWPN